MFGMALRELPGRAAWLHEAARAGFESTFPIRTDSGHRVEGHTAAVEAGEAWAVHYVISVDEEWRTRHALIIGWSERGRRERVLEADGQGRWRLEGQAAPELDGCLDVDLESSACTNTFPVHRLRLDVGSAADAPAAYVRALDLRVDRLEQRYERIDDDGTGQQYHYTAPVFDFEARLVYDAAGLVVDYPGIARRVL